MLVAVGYVVLTLACRIVGDAFPSDADPSWERYGLVFLGDGRLVLVASPYVFVLEEVDSDVTWSKARIVASIPVVKGHDAIVLLNTLSLPEQRIYLLCRSSDTNSSPHRFVTIRFAPPSTNADVVDLPELTDESVVDIDGELGDDEADSLSEDEADSLSEEALPTHSVELDTAAADVRSAADSRAALPARSESTEPTVSDELSRSTASNDAPYTPPSDPMPSAAASLSAGGALVPMLLLYWAL